MVKRKIKKVVRKVSKQTILRAFIKIQKQLADLEVLYLTSKMGKREYNARKSSLRLAFNKLKKDLIKIEMNKQGRNFK